MNETEMIRSLQKQVEELKAKLSEVHQAAPKREKVTFNPSGSYVELCKLEKG